MINTLVNYDPQKESWYSPKEIISNFEKVKNVYKENIYDSVFKRAREMYTGAVTLLGAYEINSENVYYLQANNQDTSPDVIAVKQRKQTAKGVQLEITQMEITEFEHHPKNDSVIEFLKNTKLPPKNDYGQNVMIVCSINRKISFNRKDIYDSINEINPKSTIYLIGREINAQKGEFIILSLWPFLTKPISFNLTTSMNKYVIHNRIDFKLGLGENRTSIKTVYKPVNSYEILGLKQEAIYKKYGLHRG